MIRLQIGKYVFAPKVVPTIGAIVLVPLLASLGFWQLDRADQKREIDNGVKQAQQSKPLNLNSVIEVSKTNNTRFDKEIYRSASMTGSYDTEHQYLLDNRTHKGIAGFHVLTPFLFNPKEGVLINRGWISYNGTRENIPDISVSKDELKVAGVIKKQGRAIVLKHDDLKQDNLSLDNTSNSYPKLVQEIQLSAFESDLNLRLLPIVIELDSTDKTGFVREWQPYYGSIDKHNAYALQWFVMSAILLFLFLKLNTKKVKL